MQRRACQPWHADLGYAEGRYRARQIAAAREVCDGCPVRAACYDHAFTQGEMWGVWGGVDFSDPLHRRRVKDAAEGAA